MANTKTVPPEIPYSQGGGTSFRPKFNHVTMRYSASPYVVDF